jgi:hypothetical protein
MQLKKLLLLNDQGLLSEEQYVRIEGIMSRKVISLYYELRIVLYLGVMLFAAGAGILIYQNIGELGHVLVIFLLVALSCFCFVYGFRFAPKYSHERLKAPTPYFDYVVLLGALLFVSVLTYLQIQYALFDDGLGATTLVTAAWFFFCAYRFDHPGILSLAITALASFFSISISPQKWYSGDFLEEGNLHTTALIFGSVLTFVAMFLDKRRIKRHFTFTYINFGILVFLVGSLAGLFEDDDRAIVYFLALCAGCSWAVYFGKQSRSFLFLLYAFVFGYIGLTYMLADSVLDDAGIWFFYLLLSCGGFIFFILRFRNYFKRA